HAAADVKNAGYYGHTVVCCVLTRRKGGKAMNHQRKQSMRKNPVEGRLPLWKPAFSIRMTLAAK
ncbi:hypothetical protein PND79_22080, partial [Flavonifractor plautii]|uniref:hypothetical protein n=1 Tax=Flavonifractor plautii TaxID=292800 RepID=UPI001A9AB9BF